MFNKSKKILTSTAAFLLSGYCTVATAASNPFEKVGEVAKEGQEGLTANVAPIFVIGLLVMLVLRYLNIISNKILIGAVVCLALFGLVPLGVEWYINLVR